MIRILTGDCRDVLPTLEAASFDCIVTSPPYWGLRDYGTATWEGGYPDCAHSVGGQVQDSKAPGAIVTGVRPGCDASRCRKCGARRVDAQIGLEPTLDAYVETMVAVGRELWRVLRPSGTFWLNLGDSYNTTAVGRFNGGGFKDVSARNGTRDLSGVATSGKMDKTKGTGLKPKDLCGVPWRVAFALQADGWWLRSAIVWAKPNPMPESVTDRPTSAYEMVFLLTKSERYFYDADAIAEPLDRPEEADRVTPARFGGANKFSEAKKQSRLHSGNEYRGTPTGTRNARNVWPIASQPFKGSHFATMPPDLAERCIKAGCPVGGQVLDPFGGAGTTGLVADRLGRNATLIELNPVYRELASVRIEDDAPLFANIV